MPLVFAFFIKKKERKKPYMSVTGFSDWLTAHRQNERIKSKLHDSLLAGCG